MVKKFTIDEEYICDIVITKVHSNLENYENPTPNDLITILKDEHRTTTTISHKDHPMYAALRDQLEAEGYIKCERSWWNGDRVLEPFYLNDVFFTTGDKFLSGIAMNVHMKTELGLDRFSRVKGGY